MKMGLFLFFDNLKLLLALVSLFKGKIDSQNLCLTEIDKAIHRLETAADTLRLLITDIEHNHAYFKVKQILYFPLSKVGEVYITLK